MRSHLRWLGLTAGVLMAGIGHGAEVYRWVDANGVVNFTQQKPRDVAAEHLVTRAGSPTVVRDEAAADAAAAAASDATAAAGMNDSQREMLEDLRAAEAARQEEIARIRAANCDRSRQVLANLSSRGRIRVVGEDGREQVMDEDERQRRISQAQQGIIENCSAA